MAKYHAKILKLGDPNNVITVNAIKSFKLEYSVDTPADFFDILLGDTGIQLMNSISAGDYLNFYMNNRQIFSGTIDDLDIFETSTSREVKINGRDKMAPLLDNSANPKTLYNIGLQDYFNQHVARRYGIKMESINNSPFDKIVIDPGENEYSVIEKLAKKRNLIPMCSMDGVFKCTKIISSRKPDAIITNDIPGNIRYKDIEIKVSSDIVSEVIVQSTNSDDKVVEGRYVNNSMAIRKTRIVNESDIDSVGDANNRAKLEFYNINKNAFTVSLTINNMLGFVLQIGIPIRLIVKKFGLDCMLYVDEALYSKTSQGETINLKLKPMPGIQVRYNFNHIPVLPIL